MRRCLIVLAVLGAIGMTAACSTPNTTATATATTETTTAPVAVRQLDPGDFAMATAGDRLTINVHTPNEGSLPGTDLTIPFDHIAARNRTPPRPDHPHRRLLHDRTHERDRRAGTHSARLHRHCRAPRRNAGMEHRRSTTAALDLIRHLGVAARHDLVVLACVRISPAVWFRGTGPRCVCPEASSGSAVSCRRSRR